MAIRRGWYRLVVAGSASVLAIGLAVSAGSAQAAQTTSAGGKARNAPSWQLIDTGHPTHFRGLSVVSRSVVWLGGYDGTVLRTVDGGRTWADVSPAGASTLQFRDVEAFDARHAVAMAAGTGMDSRLYVTTNGGRTWRLAYENTNQSAFFDCMSFFNSRKGLVLSDPVDGRFRILATRDGGRTWSVLPNAGMPDALPGEAGFAASGECLTTFGHSAWFGSGGTTPARIFHSRDGGRTWDVHATPLSAGPTAGVFGLAFRTPRTGVAVGGDFNAPSASSTVAAFSDRGAWTLSRTQPSGYRSGVTWLPHARATVISVGLTGSDISFDGGRTWTTFDTGQFDTVGCAHDGACWASGDLGRVAHLLR